VTAFWCELAWTGERLVADAVIEAEGERIAQVSPRVAPEPPDATRLEGLVIPGLANAHSHAFQRALRGRAETGGGSFWTWRERMYELAAALDPDGYRELATAAFAEMALAGITTVGEFHYLHHDPDGATYADPNEFGNALIAAARDAGIRITLIDACYMHGGIGAEPEGVQRRFADADVDAWAGRASALADEVPGPSTPGVRIAAAIHSVRAVEPGEAAGVAAWAAKRDKPLHAHVSEQPAENEACLEAYGSTPAGVLAEAGAVNERFVAVHATHLGDSDFELLGGADSTVCLCPTTERDLGDGIGPARRLADSGASLALGSDSNAVIDLFEEARAVELDERLASGERGRHDPAALLGAATAAGHACLGWPDAGRIEPGALCDLVAVDLDGVRLAGADREDPIPALVFAASAADVSEVVVGGRQIVADGRHASVDAPAMLREQIGRLG
jgi:formiminoglutamate deiminase